MAQSNCTFALHSPPPGPAGAGAIAIVQLRGNIDSFLDRLGIQHVLIGQAAVRDWRSVDRVVVGRTSDSAALLFPHGGSANLARIFGALEAAGAVRETSEGPIADYAESIDSLEGRLLHALARAQGASAIDLLLDQPRRWAIAANDPTMKMDERASRILRRLIDPPLVIALGAPNIGKSSLLNALAGRSVSIVADQPGTTRDHVGASLDLGGLAVRYIDTPGIPSRDGAVDFILDEAVRLGLRAAATADLILLCADPGSIFPDNPAPSALHVRVGLRADLGPPGQGCDVEVSAMTGQGLESLTAEIRNRLVPPEVLSDARAWTFW